MSVPSGTVSLDSNKNPRRPRETTLTSMARGTPQHPNTRLQEGQYESTVPTARDRTVQAALKLVLEPIFEADFKPCSYGFRPKLRAHDAIAEILSMST